MKPEQLTSAAIARPLRVAYLIDLSNTPSSAFEAIVSEAYSRWAGRRTLIVPAKREGIDIRYRDWLGYFDADIIYSFVPLDDAAVADMHERFAPAYLVSHRFHRSRVNEEQFNIQLPLSGLSSLSVLPVYCSRSWGLEGPPKNVRILTKYRSESQFLQENFGFLFTSFHGNAAQTRHSDVFTGMTLITHEAFESRCFAKTESETYMTTEDEVLEAMADNNGPLCLAQLSDCFSHYLETGEDAAPIGTYLVAGDTIADRLLWWNAHHRFARLSFSETTTVRLPTNRLDDDRFLDRVAKILERRGARGHNGQIDHVSLMSCSLSQTYLETLAARLRKATKRIVVRLRQIDDPSMLAPRFSDPSRVSFAVGGYFSEPVMRSTAKFQGQLTQIPIVMPWHMKEAMPPAGLRNGNWMINVTIDRLNDHCRFSTHRDVWRLPRRLRLERSFQIEKEGRQNSEDDCIRVMRTGSLSLAMNFEIGQTAITVPDDLSALRMGICNVFEWSPFDRDRKDAPHGRLRFAYSEPSDKGRYLLGVLGLFESIPDAFGVLMHGYWHDAITSFGGVPVEKDPALIRKVSTILRRRLGQREGPITLSTASDVERLARESVRCGKMVAREPRYRSYQWFRRRWDEMTKEFIAANPAVGEKDDSDDLYCNVERLDSSIQYLCRREVLYQGREWRCPTCYNRNWVVIGELAKMLRCSICGRQEPAPVSGDWQFKANPFIIEAYQDHGTEAVVWALWRLWERSRYSYYFAPSLKLWVKYPEYSTRSADAEVDAIAVVDGKVYLLEAKNAGGLSKNETEQLVLAAERIRPDVLLIATMEEANQAVKHDIELIKAKLSDDVDVELLTFDPKQLERAPFLLG